MNPSGKENEALQTSLSLARFFKILSLVPTTPPIREFRRYARMCGPGVGPNESSG